MVETADVEVMQLMNTSTADNVSFDQIDASLVSISPTTTLPQTGNVLICLLFVLHEVNI